MRELAKAGQSPLVKSVEQSLSVFFKLREAIGPNYEWKYLSDEAFLARYAAPKVSIAEMNRAQMSHLIRVVEAFEVTSIWRAADLIEGTVQSLNEDRFISACTTSRALIELAARYLEAQNVLRATFGSFKWETISTHVWHFGGGSVQDGEEGLEGFIERLMAGSRLKQVTDTNPALTQKNILSLIGKIDRKNAKSGNDIQIMPVYEILCELAHPNILGFDRFGIKEIHRTDGWAIRSMSATGFGISAQQVAWQAMWALSFGAGTMALSFEEFQKLTKVIGTNFGRPLPH
jgi:hypothetical protein